MFKSIVVGFDGSEQSSRALELGAELAAQSDARLGIIFVVDISHMEIPEQLRKMGEIEHVIDPKPRMRVNLENAPESMMSSVAQAHAESERTMFQYADFILQQAADNARQVGAAEVAVKSGIGDPAETIAEYATELGADLIICGSRGFGKIKSFLLGSTSAKLAHLAECSCLTVK